MKFLTRKYPLILFTVFCFWMVITAGSIAQAVASPRSEIPVPVTFNLPVVVIAAWIASIAAGLTGVLVIWRFVGKASKLITNVNEYGSVLLEIAKQFKSDSGSTLKDALNRIEKAADDAKTSASKAQKTVEGLGKKIDDQ